MAITTIRYSCATIITSSSSNIVEKYTVANQRNKEYAFLFMLYYLQEPENFKSLTTGDNITLVEWIKEKDHVHLLFKAHRNSELSKFIHACKSGGSRLLKKEYPSLRQHLWREDFWSRSFCLLPTGGAPSK